MAGQQSEIFFEEVKVPISCEFIFQKNLALSNVEDDGTTFYNYIFNEPMKYVSYFSTKSHDCFLPGFPGIRYFFFAFAQTDMIFEFQLEVDYDTYLFDIDFTCTINNNEPKHFHDKLNSQTPDEICYLLLICSKECAGCAACKDQIFVVRVEGFITVKNVDHLPILCHYYFEDYNLYDKNDTKDFVVVVEGKEIWVHKSILIKNSTVFARMLDSEKWKEATESKIVIPEFSFKVVEFAIKAFYGVNYLDSLEKEIHLPLFQFTDKYDIEKLKNAVKKCLVLTPSSVVERANFFLQNFADELVDCCIDYIFVCRQNSFPIKDIEMLDPRIQSMFFRRTLISPVLQKDPIVEHRTLYKEYRKE